MDEERNKYSEELNVITYLHLSKGDFCFALEKNMQVFLDINYMVDVCQKKIMIY